MLIYFVASSILDGMCDHNDQCWNSKVSYTSCHVIQTWVLDQSLFSLPRSSLRSLRTELTVKKKATTELGRVTELLLLAIHVTILFSLFTKPFWKSNPYRQSEVQISNAIATCLNLNHFSFFKPRGTKPTSNRTNWISFNSTLYVHSEFREFKGTETSGRAILERVLPWRPAFFEHISKRNSLCHTAPPIQS